MSATTNSKAYRVSYDETFRFHVDVIACADWQAVDAAPTLRENASNAIVSESEEPVDIGNWPVEPLKIGGQS